VNIILDILELFLVGFIFVLRDNLLLLTWYTCRKIVITLQCFCIPLHHHVAVMVEVCRSAIILVMVVEARVPLLHQFAIVEILLQQLKKMLGRYFWVVLSTK